MEEKERLFLPENFQREESVIEKKIRKFMLGFKLLETFLEMGKSPNDPESLEFYSDLYNDLAPILTEITCYDINNGYIKKSKQVEDSIRISQKILGLLKILHTRYIISLTSPDPIEDPRWDSISKKSNTEIVEDISLKLERMDSLELKGQEGVFLLILFLNKKSKFLLFHYGI